MIKRIQFLVFLLITLSVALLACGESIDDESLDERISFLTEDGSEEDEDDAVFCGRLPNSPIRLI